MPAHRTTRPRSRKTIRPGHLSMLAVAATLVAACGDDDTDTTGPAGPSSPIAVLPAARPGTLTSCSELGGFRHANLQITSAAEQADGAVVSTADGDSLPLPAHCLVAGVMNQRTGIDGRPYAIHFEMRLPRQWNGRFFHQANGGNDGMINTDATRAFGRKLGGNPGSNGLIEGWAVLSSDAGHAPDTTRPVDPVTGLGIGGQAFGLDPQARRDYGYGAVGTLTPMAKALIAAAYGRGPDRSYMVGCSNGGRHGMVAASRYANEYDGILAGDPGFNLPRAAVAQLWDTQALMTAARDVDPATGRKAIWSAFTASELAWIDSRIVARCDGLDGVIDGMVQDTAACQTTFSPDRDIAICSGGLNGGTTGTGASSCITAQQLEVLRTMFAGPKDAAGRALYGDWPWVPGLGTPGWMSWKMGATGGTGTGAAKYGLNLALGSASSAFIFTTPPADPAFVTGLGNTLIDWALSVDFNRIGPLINGTTATFPESPMAVMTPPAATDMSTLRNRGGKLLVFHGTADPVFSYNDTVDWYRQLDANHAGHASSFARLFAVPGMNHCSGGPATDRFDMLSALVDWVENGKAPEAITATARPLAQNAGLGSAVPAGRTRPLCPYPAVARYTGGDINDQASFQCR